MVAFYRPRRRKSIKHQKVLLHKWSEFRGQAQSAVIAEIGNCSNDNARLRQLTEWVRRELDLESKHKGILSDAERLIADWQKEVNGGIGDKSKAEANSETEMDWTFSSISKQERVKVARQSYFKWQEELGNHCVLIKGKTIYRREKDGIAFGITYSSDKGGKAWFLGLPENLFQEAILLCQYGPSWPRAARPG